MNMKNKIGRGFVLVAPPHLNPENLPNRYLFTGTERDSLAEMAFAFCIIPVPGFVMPEEFAAHVAARSPQQGPLHGTAELYAPEFDLGEFRYRLASGEEQKAQADDVMTVSPEKLREPKPKDPEPVPPVTPPPPPMELDIF
jgi:hypothetical protein